MGTATSYSLVYYDEISVIQDIHISGLKLQRWPLEFVISFLYHRERTYFSSTLSCNKEEEKITKPLTLSASAHFNQPSNFGLISPFQSAKQLWAHQPISISQATLGSSAHFNQPSNFGLISPFQSTRQH
jgi:hypothetical protein